MKRKNNIVPLIFIATIILFVLIVRIRLLSTPIERDEGEYAYMAQLLLKGFFPFSEAFNMKLPGTSFYYAIFLFVFGETIQAIHIGLLVANVLSIILLFLVTKNFLNARAGIVASVSYAFLSINPALLGFAAHATHFVVLFSLAGILFLQNPVLSVINIKKIFVAGIFFGLAFMMKQPGFVFFIFGLIFLFFNISKIKNGNYSFVKTINIFIVGFALPLIILLLTIFVNGDLNKFWFWTFTYAKEYSNLLTISDGIHNLKSVIISFWDFFPAFCTMFIVGLVIFFKLNIDRTNKYLILVLVVLSFIATIPGMNFRSHYFIMMLPAVSIFIASGYIYFSNLKYAKILVTIIFAMIIVQHIKSHYDYFFRWTPSYIVTRFYKDNHFNESIKIANYLKNHTSPEEKIAVLGSEPQIYFYANRRSVSGHIYMYGLMEPHPYALKMQKELVRDIENYKPNYIVFYKMGTSWLLREDSERFILDWIANYATTFYEKKIIVELFSLYDIRYIMEKAAINYVPSSENAIIVLKRKSNK